MKNIRLGSLIRNILLLCFIILMGFTTEAQQAKTYDEAIILADKLFSEQKLLDAKAYYQMALTFKAKDDYATTKINAIVKEMSSQMEREDRYLEVIEVADKLFKNNELDKAKEEYAKAMAIIPNDDYAADQINKIDDIQINQKEKLESFNKNISEGKALMVDHKYDDAILNFKKAAKIFPDNSQPSELINTAKQNKEEYLAKMEVYNEAIEMANRYLDVKNYVEAINQLKIAFELFPDNWAVEEEIKKYSPLAQNQEEYNTQISKADELYVNKSYSAAKALYLQAGDLWPENSYTEDMISRIDERLSLQMADLDVNYNKAIAKADSLFSAEDLVAAKAEYNFSLNLKPGEAYPKLKIKEIDAVFEQEKLKLEAEYSEIIASADALLEDKDIYAARTKYELALSIRPEDNYPADKLSEIEQLEIAMAAQIALQKQYDELIEEADALVISEDYSGAITKYQEALGVKSDEEYPTKRITEIEAVVANAAMQKEINEKYAVQISLAQRLFSENNLTDARSTYLAASEIKPLSEEPKIEIAKIDSIITQRENQKRIDEEYQAKLNTGDSLLALNDFDEALIAFNAALALKAGDAFAMEKIKTTETSRNEFDKAVAVQKNYDKAIREADELFASKDYQDSKASYEQALSIKTKEAYPSQKINEINNILAQIAAENERKYTETIVKADNYFDAGNLSDAVINYKIASSFKPNESYPKDRLAECNSLIEEKLALVRGEYGLAIAEADKLYAAKIYDKAITAYQKAEVIFPEESYPDEMIAKILKLIEDNAITDIINSSTVISSNTTEKFTFEPIRINVRKSNYIFVKAKNVSGKSFKIIFGYGRDGVKNGGFVVQVPEGEEENDYIIRVGNQYKWFSDDNNWISVYPENGDIEINLLRISASD